MAGIRRSQHEGVGGDAVAPAHDAHDVVEQAPWVAAREEDREPSCDQRENSSDVEEEEHDVVRDREEPLDERQPAIQTLLGVGVVELEAQILLFVG
jgi:hypothetical protein